MLDGDGHQKEFHRRSARPLTLAVGQEDLLLDRAVQQVVAAARASDADTDVRDLTSDQLQPGTLAELTSPSLFAERKVVIVRNAQDLSADTVKDVKAYLDAPVEEITLVLLHAGGAKGKALLDAARKAGAREVACPKTTKAAERLSFVRSEFRALGRSASPEACQALVDSIGSDLRELASAVSQLVADVEGTIDEAVVGRYYTGRAEASSFTVADRAVEGRAAEALEALRWSLSTGVAPVLITSALAQGVRAIGKLSSARGGRPADLARELGMPPWKIDRVRQQMRGWTPDGVAMALRAVAEADAGVKGAATTPSTPSRRPSSLLRGLHGQGACGDRARDGDEHPGRPGTASSSVSPLASRRRGTPSRGLNTPGGPWNGHGMPKAPLVALGRATSGASVHAVCAAPAWRTQVRCAARGPGRGGREGPLVRSGSYIRKLSPGGRQPWTTAPTSCWRRRSCG